MSIRVLDKNSELAFSAMEEKGYVSLEEFRQVVERHPEWGRALSVVLEVEVVELVDLIAYKKISWEQARKARAIVFS